MSCLPWGLWRVWMAQSSLPGLYPLCSCPGAPEMPSLGCGEPVASPAQSSGATLWLLPSQSRAWLSSWFGDSRAPSSAHDGLSAQGWGPPPLGAGLCLGKHPHSESAECWRFLTSASLCKRMRHYLREAEPSGSHSRAKQRFTGQAKREKVVPSAQFDHFAPQHFPMDVLALWDAHSPRLGGFTFSFSGGGCWMVAVEGPWGSLPGALRAPPDPARRGDFPFLGKGKCCSGAQDREMSGLLPPAALAWADSAFEVNSDIWANCCLEGGFTFLTGTLWLCLPPPILLFPKCQ